MSTARYKALLFGLLLFAGDITAHAVENWTVRASREQQIGGQTYTLTVARNQSAQKTYLFKGRNSDFVFFVPVEEERRLRDFVQWAAKIDPETGPLEVRKGNVTYAVIDRVISYERAERGIGRDARSPGRITFERARALLGLFPLIPALEKEAEVKALALAKKLADQPH